MYWDVLEINALAPRTLEVVFADGLNGKIVIDHSFCTGVFEALADDNEISKAFVEHGVITWPNGLDLAPDTLYKEIKNNPQRLYIIKRPEILKSLR